MKKREGGRPTLSLIDTISERGENNGYIEYYCEKVFRN